MTDFQWQPMNTAPKDGTHILVVTDGGYIGTAYWDKSHYGDWRWGGAPGDDLYWDERDLTHWMPLPALPVN